MNRGVVIAVVVLLAGAAAIIGWRESHRPPAPSIAAPAPPPPPPPAPVPDAAAPATHHPVPEADRRGLPALDDSDGYVKKALIDLLGRKAVGSFLRLDGAVRRFVATVNNLATDQAGAGLWPVNPTPGAFETETRDGALVISARNAERYAPFVDFAEHVDSRRAVALYFRLYPLLQRAYEDLGFPGKYLNDRVVEVIDNLLATPKVSGAIRVKRVGADGGASASGLYLYDDPALESASAGQKILLRIGTDNAAKLTAKLTELREAIASGPRR
ncbi:MAG TPA: DUF3014 domain-containing protein [Polyangia bacterium]|nr:DUF3014 domain-containing protein [Polyangia bacterium]